MTSNGIKLQGHTNRVFCTKFSPDDPNVVISGGWDRIMKIYDTRAGKPVAQILGPNVSGDSIDINGDELIAGSNRHE
jgi:WD40 repeat protein